MHPEPARENTPPPPQGFREWLRERWAGLVHFFHHPFSSIWIFLKDLWALTRTGGAYLSDRVREVPLHVWKVAAIVFVTVIAFILAGYSALFAYIESKVPPGDKVNEVRLLNQGWGNGLESTPRQTYYYTPQGAYLKFVRYDWMMHLERPWKTDRFTDERYMRAYGFIVDAAETEANPGRLPLGFAPRYDPAFGEVMLDLTCAACHSGELQVVKDGSRIGVRIDGGPAMHAVTSTKMGQFGTDLLASLTATYVNPFKFNRFAKSVLKDHDSAKARAKLHLNLASVIGGVLSEARTDSKLHLYDTEEGYGRTDALSRISNAVFGKNLSETNYHKGTAPVSYPPVWDIYKFDWVQYNGSVSQPMARNIGESMGVGARYYLVDPYQRPLPERERYNSTSMIMNLARIEGALQQLQPPCWPEDVFGRIDVNKARQGRQLFLKHCHHCHGPMESPAWKRRLEAPLKDDIFHKIRYARLTGQLPSNFDTMTDQEKLAKAQNLPSIPHWSMTLVPLQEIGTDTTAALNFVNRRLDLSETHLKASEIRKALKPYYVEYYQRQIQTLPYRRAEGKPCDMTDQQWADWNAYADALEKNGVDGFLEEQLGQLDVRSVSLGAGLNYLIAFIREQAYYDMGIHEESRQRELDGFGQLDIPQVVPKYKARPLAGVWATAPYLHNGSVPTLYQMLIPAHRRVRQFYLKSRLFDPVRVGLHTDSGEKGAFLFDTTVPGNSNFGHEFRAGFKKGAPLQYGIVGPELTEDERWAIIEYLKVHRDTPDNACSVPFEKTFGDLQPQDACAGKAPAKVSLPYMPVKAAALESPRKTP